MTSTRQPQVAQVQVAEESYRRCQGEEFFQAFYRRLLAADPSVPPRFTHTDFDRQNRLLQHGIGLLFIFAKRPNPTLLQRIAERHSAKDLDIPPPMYAHFVDALMATVAEYDASYGPDVDTAWRVAVAPGIEFMKSRHAAG